jgi:hypothetical protein
MAHKQIRRVSKAARNVRWPLLVMERVDGVRDVVEKRFRGLLSFAVATFSRRQIGQHRSSQRCQPLEAEFEVCTKVTYLKTELKVKSQSVPAEKCETANYELWRELTP